MTVNKLELECVEICAGSIQSALNAAEGGATRIEFCSHLQLGGTTPSHAEIKIVRALLDIEIFVLIRPRSGHFVYDSREIETMIEDIKYCKSIGIDGIVTGTLTPSNTINLIQAEELIKAASPLPVVFHRAIDELSYPESSIQDLIDLGYHRILTSGGKATAFEGVEVIKQMVEKSNGHIEILAGSGINLDNLETIVNRSGVNQIHTSASQKIHSNIQPGIFWSAEMNILQTSSATVKKLIKFQKKSC